MSKPRYRWHYFKLLKMLPICCGGGQNVSKQLQSHATLDIYTGKDGQFRGTWKIIGKKKGDTTTFCCEHGGVGRAVIQDVRHYRRYPTRQEMMEAFDEAKPEEQI